MKKLILLVALFVGAISGASAQSFNGDSRYFGVSLGFFSGEGVPITINYEQAVTDNIGVGGLIGFAGYSKDFYGGEVKYSNVLIGAKGNYHFLDNAKWDVYAGLILGYNASSAKVNWDGDDLGDYDASAGGLIIGGTVGARYIITEQFAAMAEIGYGLGLISIGATYSF